MHTIVTSVLFPSMPSIISFYEQFLNILILECSQAWPVCIPGWDARLLCIDERVPGRNNPLPQHWTCSRPLRCPLCPSSSVMDNHKKAATLTDGFCADTVPRNLKTVSRTTPSTLSGVRGSLGGHLDFSCLCASRVLLSLAYPNFLFWEVLNCVKVERIVQQTPVSPSSTVATVSFLLSLSLHVLCVCM